MLKHLKNAASELSGKISGNISSNTTVETFGDDDGSIGKDGEESGKDENLIKKPWTVEEDETLRTLIMTHGIGFWNNIAQCLPGRSGKQCRERWHNHLSPGIVKGDWTPDEDRVIVSMQKLLGNQWAKITKMLPGRTDNAVKNRFHATERHRNRKVKKLQQQQCQHLNASDLAVHDNKHSNNNSTKSSKTNLNGISMTSYNDGDNDGTLDGTEVEYDNDSYNNELTASVGSSKNNNTHNYAANKHSYASVSLPPATAVSMLPITDAASSLSAVVPVLTKKQQHQQLLLQQSHLLIQQQQQLQQAQQQQAQAQQLSPHHLNQIVNDSLYNTNNTTSPHDILGPEIMLHHNNIHNCVLDDFALHSASAVDGDIMAVPIIDRFPSPDFMLVMQQQQGFNHHHPYHHMQPQPSPLLHSMNNTSAAVPLHYLSPTPVTPTSTAAAVAVVEARGYHPHDVDYHAYLATASANNHHHSTHHSYGNHQAQQQSIMSNTHHNITDSANDMIMLQGGLSRFCSPDIMSLPSLNDVDCLELIDNCHDNHDNEYNNVWNRHHNEIDDGNNNDENNISRDNSHYSTNTANNNSYYHDNIDNDLLNDHAAMAAEIMRASTADVIMSIMESVDTDANDDEEEHYENEDGYDELHHQQLQMKSAMQHQQQAQYYNNNQHVLHMPMPLSSSTAAAASNNNCMSFGIGCGVGGGGGNGMNNNNTQHHHHNNNSSNSGMMMNMCGINYGWNTNNNNHSNHHHSAAVAAAHHQHAMMSMSPQPIGYNSHQQQHNNDYNHYYPYHN